MKQYRGHTAITISQFNGLWSRGDADTTPIDHFQDCDNITFRGNSSFGTRDGIGISQDVVAPLTNIRRIYNYPTLTGNTLIVLTYDYVSNVGKIYHVVNSTTVFGPLLTKTGMKDFAFVPYNGRAYISPIGYFTMTSLEGTLNIEKGLQNEFLYVYLGAGAAARKTAGSPLSGALTIANGAAGHTDAGLHIFGFVAETDSGYLTAPGQLTAFTTSPLSSVSFTNVDTSGDPSVTKRHLVASKKITNYNGDVNGYDLFFVPNATINNDTDTFLNNISFYDADLLDDASHLSDNYSEIPAGAVLSIYHDRLVLAATFADPNLAIVSEIGEPEAINQITGILGVTPDGNPITNSQEYRDINYIFKRSRTLSFADNGDDPSTWPQVIVDDALGTCLHGISTVLNTGSSSVDFLIIATYQGISVFVGKYVTPELSWKIENRWKGYDRNEFRNIQIVNAPIQKWILIVTPDNKILHGNYANGFDAMKIRWAPWSFDMDINTVAIATIDEIVLGSDLGS